MKVFGEEIYLLGNLLPSERVVDRGESKSGTSNATENEWNMFKVLMISHLKRIVYSGEFARTAATTSPCLPPYQSPR